MVVQITGSHTGVLASSALCMYSAHPSSMLLTKKKLFMYLYYGRMCIICFRHVRENKLTGPVDIIQLSKPQLVEFMRKDLKQHTSQELKFIQLHACHGSPEKAWLHFTAFVKKACFKRKRFSIILLNLVTPSFYSSMVSQSLVE